MLRFFVWKKISAEDVSLTAGISILSSEGNNHRVGHSGLGRASAKRFLYSKA
jgi:hypothetical protein